MISGATTVLVVDDEAAQRDLIGGILRQHGCSVLEAANCEEAVEVCRSYPGRIDLLVVDLSLPDGTGYDLCKTLRAGRRQPKVLFVSGNVGAELRRFFDVPVPDVHFLPKPFQAEELLFQLNAVVEAADPFSEAASAS